MTLIVSDTGPLLHLSEAQALDLLNLAGEVHVPRGVADEIARLLPRSRVPDWLTVEPLTAKHAEAATRWQQAGLLHRGEAEAVALAQQMQADWLVTDDAAARLLARMLGLDVHGSLGIVLWAAAGCALGRRRRRRGLASARPVRRTLSRETNPHPPAPSPAGAGEGEIGGLVG